jgi:carbonic anhydrase/acetyltransferase-like protein (isoleucine patch superfamily)
MALIRKVKGVSPKWGKNCWFADNAVLTGDVVMGDNCSVWFHSIVRGDVHSIRIGDNVNVQDGAVIHCTYKKSPVSIGNNVSIAHRAVVHGCTIGNNVLIGMGAILMDDVVVEDNCIIAAGAVVMKGTRVEKGTVWGGLPAKKLKSIDEELFKGEVMRIAESYLMYASWYDEE